MEYYSQMTIFRISQSPAASPNLGQLLGRWVSVAGSFFAQVIIFNFNYKRAPRVARETREEREEKKSTWSLDQEFEPNSVKRIEP